MIDIKGLSKAQVLHALWHASKAQGLSFLGLSGGSFTLEDAQEVVDNQPCLYFDYVAGHVIKCDLSKDEFDERLFDRDNGDGAAATAIENLRKGNTSSNENDEQMIVEITDEYLKASVFQENGWTRVNIYHKDHTNEELYER